MHCKVLYEDNHIIVVHKPAMLLTQPNNTPEPSAQEEVKAWLKEKYNKPGAVFLHVIHRIDKPVSGIVLFAKTTKALSRLQASMRERLMTKIYVAKVSPPPEKESATLIHWLMHDDYFAREVAVDHPDGKRCELSYHTLHQFDKYSLVEINLATGRYHQIRAQFAAIGSPIIGDVKYGSRAPYPAEGIALHHQRLVFPHPITKESIEIECVAPWV